MVAAGHTTSRHWGRTARTNTAPNKERDQSSHDLCRQIICRETIPDWGPQLIEQICLQFMAATKLANVKIVLINVRSARCVQKLRATRNTHLCPRK